MKLILPVFASLMLQYQVNTEFLVLKKCSMGFGRCRNQCAADEKEVQKCKKKKCCLDPKVVQFIKSYLKNQIPHVLGDDVPEMLKIDRDFAKIQTRYVFPLPTRNSSLPSASTKSVITPKATPVNPEPVTSTAVSSKSDTKGSVASATASPPPAPPPP
ncbi:beta-defensin 129 [Lepus europaeus]|uniref:beta-defensin 129 n=1 Tax=Lepus europaeus TaxID=9983 RepID=UPI002B466591|nr:beta-defensin 129 [Lepus europaeus]